MTPEVEELLLEVARRGPDLTDSQRRAAWPILKREMRSARKRHFELIGDPRYLEARRSQAKMRAADPLLQRSQAEKLLNEIRRDRPDVILARRQLFEDATVIGRGPRTPGPSGRPRLVNGTWRWA